MNEYAYVSSAHNLERLVSTVQFISKVLCCFYKTLSAVLVAAVLLSGGARTILEVIIR